MINYRKNKECYKPNELGSLYINKNALKDGHRPIIYIGGQMEHRCHLLERTTSNTFDEGHNIFSGSWFYEYPIMGTDKSSIDAQSMTDNLLNSLSMAGIIEADIVTESFGGLIGAYASIDPRIHKVYAVHPPILGTPLANPNEMSKFKELFSKQEKLYLLLLRKIINTSYGFEIDNNKVPI